MCELYNYQSDYRVYTSSLIIALIYVLIKTKTKEERKKPGCAKYNTE